MPTIFTPIERALEDLRAGRMLILMDDERREQEGDLMIAAEKITPEVINFMAKKACGLICLTLTGNILDRLEIPQMPEHNKFPNQAAFAVSFEAAYGVTTGVSAFDRAQSIRVAVNPHSTSQDISMPGHVFPLRARKGGVLERQGHTEGSVDLASLAGLQPAAVICEIMNEDGSMARLPDLKAFAEKHSINLVSINDLVAYRMRTETIIEEVSSAKLPLEYSPDFVIKIFRDQFTKAEHIALVHGKVSNSALVRIHSECLTGDVLGSCRCDCGAQLEHSLMQIAKHDGVLLYMRQEGRGIGLGNKIKAYQLQSEGLDTVEANHHLGFLPDQRSYGLCAQILKFLKLTEIKLLTNNPKKITEIEELGIKVLERIPLEIQPTLENIHYLKTKRDKLGHLLRLEADKTCK